MPAAVAEHVHDNVYWRGATPRLSVCVPAYRCDVSHLMSALAACESSFLTEIIVYDDGSADPAVLTRMQETAGQLRAAIRIVAATPNRGRAVARNAAIAHARAGWILLLDADMLPDNRTFLAAYFEAMTRAAQPAVIVGGFSLQSAPAGPDVALHRWQSEVSECLPAWQRQKSPGRYVFSSNVLVHRDVLKAAPFDEGFAGWGWEDTDWGIRASRLFPILHIDNTATHLGLDADDVLMTKYARSGPNFARLVVRHPSEAAAMPLFRMASRMRALPVRDGLRDAAAWVARTRQLPIGLRGRALKAWRALVYAEAL